MALRAARWFPIATVLSIVNLIWVALSVSEPAHAAAHLALAAVFGIWALRLHSAMAATTTRLESPEAIDALFAEVNELRRELSDVQERLDFAERLLGRDAESHRIERER